MNESKLVTYTTLIAILSYTCGVIEHFIPISAVAILSIIILLVSKHVYWNKALTFYFIFQAIVLLGYQYGSGFTDYRNWINSQLVAISILFISTLTHTIDSPDNDVDWILIYKIVTGFIISILIVSLAFVEFYPALSSIRNIEYDIIGDVKSNIYVSLQFSYDDVHALPVLIPPAIGFFRHSNSNWRWLGLIFPILLLFLLFRTSITTSLLLGITVFFLSLFWSDRRRKNVLLLIISIIIYFTCINGLLDLLMNIAENDLMASKFAEIQEFKTTGYNDDFDNRFALYDKSINSILSHPFGVWKMHGLGGHNFILDYLAFYGLPVASLLILFIIKQCKQQSYYISSLFRRYYSLGLIPFVGLCLLKGTGVAFSNAMLMCIFVFLPGYCSYFSNICNTSKQ